MAKQVLHSEHLLHNEHYNPQHTSFLRGLDTGTDSPRQQHQPLQLPAAAETILAAAVPPLAATHHHSLRQVQAPIYKCKYGIH